MEKYYERPWEKPRDLVNEATELLEASRNEDGNSPAFELALGAIGKLAEAVAETSLIVANMCESARDN